MQQENGHKDVLGHVVQNAKNKPGAQYGYYTEKRKFCCPMHSHD